jgi:predicted metalloendopeptidase
MLDMVGWSDGARRADDIVAFETQIAEASWSRIESRDRDKTYNPMGTRSSGVRRRDQLRQHRRPQASSSR